MGVRTRLKLLVVGRPQGLRRGLWRAVLARAGMVGDPPTDVPTPTEEPNAPDLAGFTWVVSLDDLRDGELTEAVVAGVSVAVVRLGDEVHVVDNTCPHADGPLGDGDVDAGQVVCPLHGWRFDLRTGACDVDPTAVLPVWRVSVVGSDVWAAAPT